ncbi:dTDP-4-amino-4,6-dideoxy-D-galactose acyltransferase [Chryseobacterium defluvii]|uniref:dTDP-4-amino-4,6-dideoxy-D-galactose acyltransferase n=1 Tax=Chryseobacterium defluvii TaxID=160396 RepID=A0A840KF15_9FLAO|nr:GNAT family N-acetyltransferase [Chryseobacterium defluvii]MBB4806608.1 dTDP-4-amino-4,6-dideoxy-D-galactose acyltransferase [Chryseobacterium defluvii]
MKINFLPWDSDFFSKKIGDITLDQEEPVDTENYDLIVVKQLSDFLIDWEGYDLSFKETKVNFIKPLDHLHNIGSGLVKDSDNEEKEEDFFKELAYESGKMSRFLLDKSFGEAKFKELYDRWVINSLNKKFAVKTFYIEESGKAIGFVTVQKYDDLGKIGLIATHPEYQGKGFGRKLLQTAENFCLDNGMTHLEIPTQKENIQACSFYKKQGYEIKDEIIIKHYWKNDSL